MQQVGAVQWLVSLAPVAVLFAAIALARVRVSVAGVLGLAVTLVSAALLGTLSPESLWQGTSSGLASALSIMYAVCPAMVLYDVMRESGAFDVVRAFVCGLSGDRLALVLFFGWVFSSFLQSVTGFGVPVAVCAPFLVALGLRPVPAVVLTLVGHSWANTFGTLAMAWDALVDMGPVGDVASTSLVACALLWLLNLSAGVIICALYAGARGVRHGLALVLSMSTIMGGGQLLVGQANQTIAAFVPTAAAVVACVALFRAGAYARPWRCESRMDAAEPPAPAGGRAAVGATAGGRGGAVSLADLAVCASPFAVLAVLSALVFAVPAVWGLLSPVSVGGVRLVCHAGFVLTLTCLYCALAMRLSGRIDTARMRAAASVALSRLTGVFASVVMLVVMARLMQTTGQMDALASGVALAAGAAYVPLAPALGTLGAFVTSSNMSSNILLAGFQSQMADRLSVDPSYLLAGQTAGAAAGAAIGPSTILLGATTADAAGHEGEILRPLLVVSCVQALALGAILAGVVALAG
ncbi:MAG: L-lactate permease [Coriobacteriales bacterium]|jgi:lactate permease